jgi:superkiller protein 3
VVDHTGFEPQIVTRIEQARRALEAAPGSAEAWGKLGQVLQAHDVNDDALSCYEQAMALDPRDYRWPYLAALTSGTVDVASALSYFEKAAGMRPDNPALYVHYGDALLGAGRTEQAERQYRTALEADAHFVSAMIGLARAATVTGDDNRALALLDEAAAAAPNHAAIHLLAAQIHQRQGDPQRARQAQAAEARGADPGMHDPVVDAMLAEAVSSAAWAERGVLLAQQGRLDEAARIFRRVLELRAGNAADYANLGGVLARSGRLGEAVEVLEAGLVVAPRDVKLLNNLGMALAQRGDETAGMERLRQAVEADPAFAGARFNMALILSRSGHPADALEHYEIAIRLDPSFAAAHTNYGIALSELGRREEAIAEWRQALEIDPQDRLAARHLERAEGD